MEQNLSQAAAVSSPPKKKRGRPKKSETPIQLQNAAEAASTKIAKDPSKVRRRRRRGSFSKPVDSIAKGRRKKKEQESSSSPTEDVDANTFSDPVTDKLEESAAPADVKLGQKVHGVVDGTFDAGYLVTVRVGDTETMFRGVVFGPGLSLPLSRENDVAPKMKAMNRDDEDNPSDVAQSPVSLNETVAPAQPQVPANSASLPMSSSIPPAREAQRAVAMLGSMGLTGFPRSAAPSSSPPTPNPTGTAGYSPGVTTAYRSPPLVQSPTLPNVSGGFYYAPPAYALNPNSNHGPGYYPPRGNFAPYSFQYIPRAEYPAGSPQFTGPAPAGTASVSAPSPANLQGTSLPPRSS